MRGAGFALSASGDGGDVARDDAATAATAARMISARIVFKELAIMLGGSESPFPYLPTLY